METPLDNQVTPTASLDDHSTLPTGNSWSCQQNNANNAYYVTIPSANVNNNNKNNTYAVVPVAESDRLLDLLFEAESDCWRNKKRRFDAANADIIRKVREESERVLSSLGLTLHPTKFYIQPVRHGVQFCGRVIYADRMYIGNRTVRACKNSIRLAIEHCSLENAYKLQSSFNSYVGFMCHCRSYNIQKMLMQMVLNSDYKQWLYFKEYRGKIVCKVKNEYKPKNIRIKELHEIREHQKLYEYEYRSKSKCSTKQRAA